MNNITCDEAKRLMNKIYDGEMTEEINQQIQHHCETCEDCRKKFNEINTFADREKRVEEMNKEIKKNYRKKIRKRIIIITSIVLVISLFASFYLLVVSGKMTFIASVDYGVAETYTERTKDHPSFNDVKNAIDACKDNYSNLSSKGTILLSLAYNDKYTFNKKCNLDNVIAINFKYMKIFNSQKKGMSFGDTDESLIFLVKYDEDFQKWITYGYTKVQQLVEMDKK